jgi:purine nucleosidase
MAAVAIVKNPAWAAMKIIPGPVLINNRWKEQPGNPRKIGVWENFDKKAILDDFYQTMDAYQLAELP